MRAKIEEERAGNDSGTGESADLGRREFIKIAAMAAAGAGAAGLLKPAPAEASGIEKKTYGAGPYKAARYRFVIDMAKA